MILLLGGTADAAMIAEKIKHQDKKVIYSLAGRTKNPVTIEGVTMRSGGFGGTQGLCQFLREKNIKALINATHPYAAKITAHAEMACQETFIPLLRFLRPAWEAQLEDRWEYLVEDELLSKIEGNDRTILVTLGAQGSEPLLRLSNPPRLFIRSTEEAPFSLHTNITWIKAKGPFTLAEEITFFKEHNIQAILCRNSGGRSSYAKILAARKLQLPIWMIRRPVSHGPYVSTSEEVLSWLDRLFPESLFPGRKI